MSAFFYLLFFIFFYSLTPAFGQGDSCSNPNSDMAYSTDHLVDNVNGTVSDNKTGLMWKKCLEGTVYSNGDCTGTAAVYTWSDALDQGASSVFAGYTDWRLPNIKELQSIVEEKCNSPAINDKTTFPATPVASVNWSNSPRSGTQKTWTVNFQYGVVSSADRTDSNHVRLVRDIPQAN